MAGEGVAWCVVWDLKTSSFHVRFPPFDQGVWGPGVQSGTAWLLTSGSYLIRPIMKAVGLEHGAQVWPANRNPHPGRLS
jgi:hypothetical protein